MLTGGGRLVRHGAVRHADRATAAGGLQPAARIVYDTMVPADMTGAPFALCRRTATRIEET
jgi:hypothetical protein